jgi:hypothetical protein
MSKPFTVPSFDTIQASVAQATDAVAAFAASRRKAALDGHDQALAVSKDQLAKALTQVATTQAELLALARGNAETGVRSYGIAVERANVVFAEIAALAKTYQADAAETGKAARAVKSLPDLFKVQAASVRLFSTRAAADGQRVTALATKAMQDAAAPLRDRANAVVATFAKAA